LRRPLAVLEAVLEDSGVVAGPPAVFGTPVFGAAARDSPLARAVAVVVPVAVVVGSPPAAPWRGS
jgi:hypothetical protein